MEFKKKTIIWEDNNEPPKDYIGVKSDGKAYEYSYSQRKGIESKSINGSGGGEPIEVNPTIEDGDVTTPLNALKIGESVYTVGCGSDSDIQIVELTYDHIPATGTLSASDLAKLDSDNCLLVMKGKYFRKTFSSDGGIDYKEIGLATVLGGVRSIYFTASKPSGEYTIAYTYPVEANTQNQANATLENIKVGNTTYSVPPAPMFVRCVFGEVPDDMLRFPVKPIDGSPSLDEAIAHMKKGGLVYICDEDGNAPRLANAFIETNEDVPNTPCILFFAYKSTFIWSNGGLNMLVAGTISPSGPPYIFTPAEEQPTWNDAFQFFEDGNTVFLNVGTDDNPSLSKVISFDAELGIASASGIEWQHLS